MSLGVQASSSEMIAGRIFIAFLLVVLSGCQPSERLTRVAAYAPYNDILPVSKEKWHRRFSEVLASHRGEITNPQTTVVCGPGVRLPSLIKPGCTIRQAVRDAGRQDVVGFCAVAVFRSRDGAFYSVTDKSSRPHDPFSRHLFFTDRLLLGDTLILLEQMICF
ncbi:MAG: hypothetical protein JNN17_00350 [Verrucomicrobiaceae bacterium]|nr:hypothetical protein [Verrucomicrobiaceae bacterium]